jgi:hypothetical protein
VNEVDWSPQRKQGVSRRCIEIPLLALRAPIQVLNSMIRVVIPYHLKNLANVTGEVTLDVDGPITVQSVLDALEARYPVLRGTIRDHETGQRRPMVRFYACEQDFSNDPPDTPLPAAVASGTEPFLVIGAIAGG